MAAATGTETVGLVQQFVERTGQLYSLPAAAAEILRLTSEPIIDPQAIKKCLESDPALTARILRVVNSSLFGPSRQVTDLNQALTLLGIRPLKMLVLGFSLPKELFTGLEAEVLARYWRETLVKAVAAREFSERLWQIPGDEPFLAGLVQNIGILALIQQLGPTYQSLLTHVRAHGVPLLQYELDTLGFDHLVLSSRLLSYWGLPAGLCAAISVPPDENRIAELNKSEQTLPRILHLSHLMAVLIDQPYGSALSELLAVGSQYCGLTYEKLQPVVVAVQAKVSELAKVLTLQLPDGLSYVDLLLEAHERLANESMASAAPKHSASPEADLLKLTSDLREELSQAVQRPGARPAQEAKAIVRTDGPTAPPTSPNDFFDPSLESQAAAAIQRSRQFRRPLTLAFVEIDAFADLLVQAGPSGSRDAVLNLCDALCDSTGDRSEPLIVSDSRLAILWEDCSRSEGVQRAREILAQLPAWSRQRFRLRSDLAISIGLAALESAPKNYPVRQLIDAACRCLSSAQLSGGNTVKSIEV